MAESLFMKVWKKNPFLDFGQMRSVFDEAVNSSRAVAAIASYIRDRLSDDAEVVEDAIKC